MLELRLHLFRYMISYEYKRLLKGMNPLRFFLISKINTSVLLILVFCELSGHAHGTYNSCYKFYLKQQEIFDPRVSFEVITSPNNFNGILSLIPGLRTTITRYPSKTIYSFTLNERKSDITVRDQNDLDRSISDFFYSENVSSPPNDNLEARINWERKLYQDGYLADIYRLSLGEKSKSGLSLSLLHEKMNQLVYLEKGKIDKISSILFLEPIPHTIPVIGTDPSGQIKFLAGEVSNLHGVYYKASDQESALEIVESFIDSLSQQSPIHKQEIKSIGIGLHVDLPDNIPSIIYAIRGDKHSLFNMEKSGIENLPSDIWNQVIQIYRQRFIDKLRINKNYTILEKSNLMESFEQKLISALQISNMLSNRSLILAWSKDPNSSFTHPSITSKDIENSHGFMPRNSEMPEHLKIEGAITAVFSEGAHEPLPCELLLNIRLPRNGQSYLEFGRLGVLRGQELPVGDYLIKLMTALANGTKNVGKIIVHADDIAHRNMYTKIGFTEMALDDLKSKGLTIPDGTTILEGTPIGILNIIMKK